MPPTKQFIIDHMNADHQDSLALYLQAYNRVPSSSAQSAHLEDITLSDLLITTTTTPTTGGTQPQTKTRYSVPINPPMTSLSETRPRVVAMTNTALARLNLSDVPVPGYTFPRGIHAIFLLASVALPFLLARPAPNFPGFGLLPDSARQLTHACQPWLLPGLLGTHALEAVAFARLRLRVHRVPAWSAAWWAWITTVMVEGVFAWRWFAEVVREERVRREHAK